MNQRVGYLACAVAAAAVVLAHEASAQPLGAFYWQLQPYCNVIALHITQHVTPSGAVYALTGFDDQCGATERATVVGTATFNHDGSVGVGLTIVVAPGGAPVHVDARVALASLSGPWVDSAGNAGAFVPASGPVTGLLRPVPSNGIAPGSITASQLAAGVVGAAQIDPSQVQARVGGSCPVGQYLRGIHPNGTVLCEPLLTPNLSTTADDPLTSVGSDSSIALGADGLPVISYLDSSTGGVRVTHCGNAACTTGNVSNAVDGPAASVGSSTSIAIGADGLPVISYHDGPGSALRVTHCGNATCTEGNESTTVDRPPGPAVGAYSSIAIGADALPIISHWDSTSKGLRVTHCGNAACTAGNVSNTIDGSPGDEVGSHTSIAIGADSLAIISHLDLTAGALRVTHCGDAACAVGNISTTVDAFNNGVGEYSSIAIGADRLPIISHWDYTIGGPRVTHCGNATCTAGNISTTIDALDYSFSTDTSIAIGADGLPIVSHRYQFTGPGALRVTHCGNVACTAGNVSTTIDAPVNSVGFAPSIAIGADGLPVISHGDETAGTLRVTKCATRTCQ